VLANPRSLMRLRSHQFFHPPNDLRCWHLQDSRNPRHNPNRRAVNSALNEADVGPVKPTLQGQAFLRDLLVLPDFPERLPKCLLRARLGLDLFSNVFARSLRQQINADTLPRIVPRSIFRIYEFADGGKRLGHDETSFGF